MPLLLPEFSVSDKGNGERPLPEDLEVPGLDHLEGRSPGELGKGAVFGLELSPTSRQIPPGPLAHSRGRRSAGSQQKRDGQKAVPLRIKPGIKRELVERFSSWSAGISGACPSILSAGLPWRR